jgi:hypothetical protein
MSFGKSSSYTTPQLTQEQKDQIAAQTGFFTGTIAPTYQEAVRGATELYNENAPGVLNAAQNQAGIARQAQDVLGSTGESALRTGVTGLQSIFNPNYEANQIQAALAPAQAQFQQNIAGLRSQFGGAGNLGSARQALAERQLAGSAQAQQASTAAQIQKDVMAQRLAAGQALSGIGQGGLGQAMGAAGQVVTAAMTPQDLFNKYAGVIFGTPSAAYNPNFAGTQGQSQTGMNFGIKI